MTAGLLILAALGLWLALEGLAYALAPDLMRRFGAWIAGLPPDEIRQSGLVSVILGLVLLYLAVHFG